MKSPKKSYFKYYRRSFAVLVFCVIISVILMITFSSRLYKNEKFNEIEAVSNLFIGGVKDEFEQTNNIYSDDITKLHDGFVNNYGISLYVYDKDGNCILSPNQENREPLSQTLKDRIDDDNFLDFDANEISDKEPSILYGDRFTVRYGQNKPQRMYLAAYSSAKDINAFNIKLIICSIVICIICIIPAMYLLKKHAEKQNVCAEDFLRVLDKYSKGDFSEHINITTPGNLRDISKYVNALAANVEKADETSKTFIANVSHELRTPITTIGGFVDGILDGTIPKSRQQEYLVLVSKEIKRLRILISSMLNMTRFESGTLKPNFKETNLTELVIQTVLMFEKKIDDKGLDVEGLDSERLNAVVDPDLMQQVIYNLVENAVKFVNENGTLSFRFEKEDGMCLIGIKNTGEGLKNNEIQQVFDRFYKTDSSRGKDATGLGLGLSISRKIVHLHNGKIIVKSVYGEYTEFLIRIPEKQK